MSQVCGRLEGIALAYGDGFGGRTYHMALYVSLSSLTLGGEARGGAGMRILKPGRLLEAPISSPHP